MRSAAERAPSDVRVDEALATLHTLLARAAEDGLLFVEELRAALGEVELTEVHLEDLLVSLHEQGIALVTKNERFPPALGVAGDGASEDEQTREPELDIAAEPASDSLERYLRQISRIALLTASQEVVLAKRVERGDLS